MTGILEYEAGQAPFRFERRQGDRWSTSGAATAFRLGGDQFGLMHDLQLLDGSVGGIGAVSTTPIEPGTVVSVGFEDPTWTARRGVVVRCLPCGDGYRVGVRYEGRLAA
ncbi:MAG: PilZ domain-containing protein [Planctomycetota bacterium]|jgi:hypothetical protein